MHCLRFALLPLLAVGCAETPPAAPELDAGPTSQLSRSGPPAHQVSAGGGDVCEALGLAPGCDGNYSLVATQAADGSVSGQWQDSFGHGNGGVHIAVDCVIVYGNQAVVGGVVTKFDDDPSQVGTRAVTSVVDNGSAANDVPDQISASYFGFPPQVGCDYFPLALIPLRDLIKGQVVVQ